MWNTNGLDEDLKISAWSGYINENESCSALDTAYRSVPRLLRQRVALGNAETQKRQNTNLLSTNNSESRWSFARTRIDAKVTADGFRTAELIPAHRLITFPGAARARNYYFRRKDRFSTSVRSLPKIPKTVSEMPPATSRRRRKSGRSVVPHEGEYR